MFATIVVRKYCMVRFTIENILKINSFIVCMPRNIARLVMKNMERIYYCQRNEIHVCSWVQAPTLRLKGKFK